MSPAPKFGVFRAAFALGFLAISGCAGIKGNTDDRATIHIENTSELSGAAQTNTGKRVALRIAAYSDRRPAAPSRKIGDVHATVFDMHQTDLVLDHDISSAVTAAIGNTLATRGFQVLNTTEGMNPSGADAFQVSGSVRKFALDIGARDQLAIAVETTVREGSGRVLWSGVVSETGDRYAGVTGNTRESIAKYLSAALKTVADKTTVQVNDAARQARPDLFGPSLATTDAVPGVHVIVPALLSAPSEFRSRSDDAPTLGRLNVATTPPRAKVYLGDVYWGLSPLNLDLAPDIYLLRVSLEGYKTASEKVSVRRAAATELEITLEK